MTKAKEVENLYFDNWDNLDIKKKFHFASRLYIWTKEEKYKKKIDSLNYLLDEINFREIDNRARIFFYHKKESRNSRRNKYIKKNQDLFNDLLKVYYVFFADSIYKTNYRQKLREFFDEEKVKNRVAYLHNNKKTLYYLSTYGINYIYLTSWLYGEKFEKPEEYFNYILSSKPDSNLRICLYYLTHTIIAKSLFYQQFVTSQIYKEIYFELENIIKNNFKNISLDIKLELLICAKMINKKSILEDRIRDEVMRSFNDRGLIIDKYNDWANITSKSLLKSEHRNLLFLLASKKLK